MDSLVPVIPSAALVRRVLLIDDELPARLRLRTHLTSHPDFAVVGEYGNTSEGITGIRLLQPDVVFLDIEMPGANGLTLWREHGVTPPPLLVLVTAYREFALEGFELRATDYLLKPFTAERFARTLGRVRRELRVPSPEPPRRLVLKHDGEYHLLAPETIIRMEAQGDFVRVHASEGDNHFVRQTLGSLQARLDPSHFLRVHRSHVVNRMHIAKIAVGSDGDYSLTMTDGAVVPVARALTDTVRPLLAR